MLSLWISNLYGEARGPMIEQRAAPRTGTRTLVPNDGPHQYEDFGTQFMIYGPRSSAERELVLTIIKESNSLARSLVTQ